MIVTRRDAKLRGHNKRKKEQLILWPNQALKLLDLCKNRAELFNFFLKK